MPNTDESKQMNNLVYIEKLDSKQIIILFLFVHIE